MCYISDKHKATGKPEVMSLEPLPAQLGKGRSTMELGSEIPREGWQHRIVGELGCGEWRGQEAEETRRAVDVGWK